MNFMKSSFYTSFLFLALFASGANSAKCSADEEVNYYAILGVTEGTSRKAMEAAYKAINKAIDNKIYSQQTLISDFEYGIGINTVLKKCIGEKVEFQDIVAGLDASTNGYNTEKPTRETVNQTIQEIHDNERIPLEQAATELVYKPKCNEFCDSLGISPLSDPKDENPENLYATLGIRDENGNLVDNPTEKQIKERYRNLSKKFHPDRLGREPLPYKNVLTVKFQKIQNAYDILANNDSRSKYDGCYRLYKNEEMTAKDARDLLQSLSNSKLESSERIHELSELDAINHEKRVRGLTAVVLTGCVYWFLKKYLTYKKEKELATLEQTIKDFRQESRLNKRSHDEVRRALKARTAQILESFELRNLALKLGIAGGIGLSAYYAFFSGGPDAETKRKKKPTES